MHVSRNILVTLMRLAVGSALVAVIAFVLAPEVTDEFTAVAANLPVFALYAAATCVVAALLVWRFGEDLNRMDKRQRDSDQ